MHSVSLWFWSDVEQSTFGGNEHALWGTGGLSNSTETGLSMYNTYVQVWRASGATRYPMTFNANRWNHLCMAYSSGGSINSRLWLNGVELTQNSSVTSTSAYSFQTGEYLILGTWINNATVDTSYTWDGKISNFKLYDVALTASEVKTLYDMGRTGSVANPQPLHIAAPLYAPGSIVQVQYASTPLNNTTKQTIVGGELSDASNDIDYLDTNFKPKFANSSILLVAMIVFSPGFVTSFGFKEDNTTVRTQGNNTNTPGGIFTYYDSTNLANDRMKVANIQVMIPANGTHTRRYNAAAASSWGNNTYTLTINDRGSNDMRSISNMVVYEIAN